LGHLKHSGAPQDHLGEPVSREPGGENIRVTMARRDPCGRGCQKKGELLQGRVIKARLVCYGLLRSLIAFISGLCRVDVFLAPTIEIREITDSVTPRSPDAVRTAEPEVRRIPTFTGTMGVTHFGSIR
jgi:hypothetical protein